jgi:hypothetical protein
LNWFDWHTVTDRLEGRSQALTRGLPYKVTLDTSLETAACNITSKLIRINPIAFDHKIKTSDDNLRARTNYLVTRALLGHEVLHALNSDPAALPADDIHRCVTNILEDARIEGIGMEESMVNRQLFKFLSTICRQDQSPFDDFGMKDKMSWMKLLFIWRFGGSLPTLPDTKHQKILNKMIGMAEDSLYAADSMEVAKIAADICKLTGMSQRVATKSEQQFPEQMDDLKDSLEGQGEVKPNPRRKPEQKSEDIDKPKRKSRSPVQSLDDKAEDVEQDTHPQEADVDSDTTDSCEEDDVTGSAVASGNDANSHDISETGQSKGPDAQTNSFGAGAGSGVGDSDDGPDDDDSLEDLVGSLQSSISDGLDKATDVLDNDEMTKVIEAHLSFENDVFNITPAPYIDLLNEARPLVNQLVKELKLPAPRASTAADRYSGRFKARYYIRKAEAPFARKKNIGIDVPPMALSLILDRSGSMINMISSLKLAAVGIARACCEELNIPLDIWVLEGAAQIKSFDEHGPQVYARIAGIRAAGGTDMIPTLLAAQESLAKRPEPLKQMLLVHDGVPDGFEITRELLSSAPFMGLYAMYVVQPLEDPELLQRYTEHGKECLSRLFDPRQFTVAPIDKIFSEWANFMKIYRSRYATSVR